jgi:serine/threonine-protein kinase
LTVVAPVHLRAVLLQNLTLGPVVAVGGVVMKSYRLFEAIASGGMGTVHYGRQNGGAGLSRVVAIKRMHRELANNAGALAMFHDELRLATRVRHPNVIATIDVVEEERELFLVMEYVQGQSVQELIARGGRLPPAIAVSIVCGILQGLQAVHDARSLSGEPLGIVHRDVSPENIMVGRDGIARLLDFGIARGAGRKHVTRAGDLKGKPSYMAPEQVLGHAVDSRTDIYGASVVLWEALTGRRLFEGERVSATLSRVLTGPVMPPSQLAHGLPPGLDELVLRGLSRDPRQRFTSAHDMARELQRVCATLLPFQVGEWLHGVAADALRRQSETVYRLENAGDDAGHETFEQDDSPDPTPSTALKSAVRTHVSIALTGSSEHQGAWVDRAAQWLAERPMLRHGLFGVVVVLFGFSAGLLVVSRALASTP